MKKIENIFAYATITLFCVGFFSCSNMQDSGAQAANIGLAASDGAYITVGLNDGIAKTVLPDFQNAVFKEFVLKGAKSGQTQITLGSWANISQMQSAAVPLELGAWNFTLTAKSGGSSFSATLQKEIVVGQNALTFNLALVDGGTQTGSFSISISFAAAPNANQVTSVVATLENLDGSAMSGYDGKNLTISDNAVVFDGSDITAGTYRARVKFYASSHGKNFELGSYKELVQISSGFCSSANRAIDSFDELYTVTYELNGGSFAAGTTVPETFTRKTNVILPIDASRNYYDFCGWYADIACSDGKELSVIENVLDDVTVYAKWTPIVYKIYYQIDGQAYDALSASYTVEDDVTLTLPVEEELALYNGWHLNSECRGNGILGWQAAEQHSDITVYGINALLTSSNIEKKFRQIEYCQPGTLIAVGDFNFEQVKKVGKYTKSAFRDLKLDMSRVTGITDLGNAFYASMLSGFIFPETMTSITSQTADFISCKFLKTVTLPKNVNEFDPYVFHSCSSLEEIKVDQNNAIYKSIDGVLYKNDMKEIVFVPRGNLESFVVPEGVTSIGTYAFDSCKSLQTVNIPDGVVSIGKDAFSWCESLESMAIPDTVTSIGESAFYGCSSLQTVNIPDGVKNINPSAFSNCIALQSVSIPDSVTSIGAQAFFWCTSLQDVTIPDSVTYIGKSAFRFCSSLKSINIPNNVTRIETGTFCACSSLESVTIPTNVKDIFSDAFTSCTSLKSAIFMDTTSLWYAIGWSDEYEWNKRTELGAMSATDTGKNAELISTVVWDLHKRN